MKFVLIGFVAFWASQIMALDIFEGAPPVPPGYQTHQEARDAVMSAKVQVVTVPENLPDSIEFIDDAVYSIQDGKELSLDIYLPRVRSKPAPCLLFIHGGGWRGGKKEDYKLYNVKFAQLGYVTASVQYRLSPENTFPAAVQDVKCAIKWLKSHAREYGIDPDRIAAIGGSAGGHLALMAGYAQSESLECPELGKVDSAVHAVVNLYGVVDCTTAEAIAAQQVKDFIGESYEDAAEKYELASPLTHLDKQDPPTLTFHGTIDELVPVSQADTLHKKLNELGIPNYYDKIEGWPHTMDLVKSINDRCVFIMERFFKAHLQRH